MTRLHRAVYYNQEGIVYDILEWAVVKKKKPEVAEWIVNCVACDDDGFTPFYVAFARGHKELCTKIMEFLNQVLGRKELEKYWTHENGFLQSAFLEAISFEEIEMFEMILTNSKEILGQYPWDCDSMSYKWRMQYIPLISFRKKCVESIAKFIIGDQPNNKRYKKLSDFVFLNKHYGGNMLKNLQAETREKMFEAGGREKKSDAPVSESEIRHGNSTFSVIYDASNLINEQEQVDDMLKIVVPDETLEKMFEADGGVRNRMQRFLKIEKGLDRLRSIIISEMTSRTIFGTN